MSFRDLQATLFSNGPGLAPEANPDDRLRRPRNRAAKPWIQLLVHQGDRAVDQMTRAAAAARTAGTSMRNGRQGRGQKFEEALDRVLALCIAVAPFLPRAVAAQS